ncbi:MAG: hypothetical protein IPM71_04955 [Bacteroidota bacterium]|nr:MAG: hypothetical protein IPM71_04955 [Bacteroidota bacterium]
MNPVKSFIPVTSWLLRISAFSIIYSYEYIETAVRFGFNNLAYFFSLVYSTLAVLLVIGGFQKSENLSVITGMLLAIICVTDLIFGIQFSIPHTIKLFPLFALGVFFMARGNASK